MESLRPNSLGEVVKKSFEMLKYIEDLLPVWALLKKRASTVKDTTH